jgi:hypothetical protein
MDDGGEWPSEPEAAERIRRRSSQRLVTPPGPVTFVSRAVHAAPIERLRACSKKLAMSHAIAAPFLQPFFGFG